MLEGARNQKQIGKSLEAAVSISLPKDFSWVDRLDKEMLADLLIVSQVETSLSQDDPMGGQTLSFRVLPAAGQKCERCWKVLPTVGSDAKHPTLCPRCARVVAASTSFEAL